MDGFCATTEEYLILAHKRPVTGAERNVLFGGLYLPIFYTIFSFFFKVFLRSRIIIPLFYPQMPG